MRLGQLARKLNVKPSEIAEFLNNEHQLSMSVHPNSKIPDELVDTVKDKFYVEPVIVEATEETPDKIIEKPSESLDEITAVDIEIEKEDVSRKAILTSLPETEPIQERSEPIELEEKEINSLESEWENVEFIPEDVKSNAETIKAPKIDLEGLKVVGKIDLPEPKPVEISEDESSNSEEAPIPVSKPMRKSSQEKRKKSSNKASSESKIARQKQEKEEALRKRIEEKKSAKKKAHYEKILADQKSKTLAKNNRKKKKSAETLEPKKKKKQANEPAPKGFWAKFKKWLNDS